MARSAWVPLWRTLACFLLSVCQSSSKTEDTWGLPVPEYDIGALSYRGQDKHYPFVLRKPPMALQLLLHFPGSLEELAQHLSEKQDGGKMKVYVGRGRHMVKGLTARPYGKKVQLSKILDILASGNSCRHILCNRYLYPRLPASNVPCLLEGITSFQQIDDNPSLIRFEGLLPPTLRVSWQNIRWAMHYDNHCNTVVQLSGKKTWRFLPPNSTAMEHIEHDESRPSFRHGSLDLFENQDSVNTFLDEGAMEVVLEAGDIIVVPKGWLHAVQAEEGFSSSVNWFYDCGTDNTSSEL